MSYLSVDNLEVGGFSKCLPSRKSSNTSTGTTKRLEVGSFKVVAVVHSSQGPGLFSSFCSVISSSQLLASDSTLVTAAAVPHII